MSNILNLNPRLEAARIARLSEIHNGQVISDKALELISDALENLDNKIIEAGEYAKVIDQNKVFKVYGHTKGREFIPDGWLIEKCGNAVNPAFCEKYKGAISALKSSVD